VAQALVIGKGATYAFAKADELYGVAVYPDVENTEDDLELPDMDGQHRPDRHLSFFWSVACQWCCAHAVVLRMRTPVCRC